MGSTDRERDARACIVDVAERLFAEEGLAVSLRQVGAEAGQRNNSAVQYHFGSREGLVAAIVAARSHSVEARRAELVAELAAMPAPPVRALVGLLVRPLAETLTAGRSHYLRFLTRVVERDELHDALRRTTHPDGLRYMTRELATRVPGLSPATFERRLRWTASIALRQLADLERDAGSGAAPDVDAVVADLLVMLEALLLAPEPVRAPTVR
jgi:AcrR family transcriptional regulator